MRNAGLIMHINKQVMLEPFSPLLLGGISPQLTVSGFITAREAKTKIPVRALYDKVAALIPVDERIDPEEDVYFIFTNNERKLVLADSWIKSFVGEESFTERFTLTFTSQEESMALKTLLASHGFYPKIETVVR